MHTLRIGPGVHNRPDVVTIGTKKKSCISSPASTQAQVLLHTSCCCRQLAPSSTDTVNTYARALPVAAVMLWRQQDAKLAVQLERTRHTLVVDSISFALCCCTHTRRDQTHKLAVASQTIRSLPILSRQQHAHVAVAAAPTGTHGARVTTITIADTPRFLSCRRIGSHSSKHILLLLRTTPRTRARHTDC